MILVSADKKKADYEEDFMGVHKLESDDFINDLKLLHEVVTKNYHSENDLFREYLEIGKRLFHLDTGIVSRIENDVYTILAYSSPLEGLEVGQTFPLEDTYCREVFERRKTVAFPHVGANKKMCNHPVYINMQLESYISAPIYVNGEIFGTINFTDKAIRHEGFDFHQFELIEIMANTIGRFIEAKLIKEELNKTNEELSDANDKINRLVGVVAHDLKNPLGNVLSLSEMICEETKEEETEEYIKLIKMTSESCLEMVESILNMSAIESGKIQINKSESNLKSLVESSWALIKYLGEKKNISLELEGDENLCVYLDKERIRQTFTNLFTNAIKFSEKGKKIYISWASVDNNVIIKVKDEGVGMTSDQIETDFDPTKTTSTNGTEGEQGTGYGLPLVAKIVSYHDGSIIIDSKKDNGTTFVINLPL